MANFTEPFGHPDEVKKTTDDKTPQQKKFERATGKDADGAVGPVHKKATTKKEKTATESERGATDVPKGLNKGVWAQAESNYLSLNGGANGSTREGRSVGIQKIYDQMVERDRQDKAWAGDGKDNGILGNI